MSCEKTDRLRQNAVEAINIALLIDLIILLILVKNINTALEELRIHYICKIPSLSCLIKTTFHKSEDAATFSDFT